MKHRWLQLERWRLRRRALDEPLRTLVREDIPGLGAATGDVEFVALDIETTGLDPATAQVLSIGWVIVRDGRVNLATAESHIVRPEGDVGHSATVHGLTDTLVESGQDRGLILDKVVEVLAGRVLLVHHAGLDKALLDRLCRERYGVRLPVPVVDTLALEHRRQRQRHHIEANSSLRLPDLRDAYGLPPYGSHDCLADAIATAELLIAMVVHGDGMAATRLGDLLAA